MRFSFSTSPKSYWLLCFHLNMTSFSPPLPDTATTVRRVRPLLSKPWRTWSSTWPTPPTLRPPPPLRLTWWSSIRGPSWPCWTCCPPSPPTASRRWGSASRKCAPEHFLRWWVSGVTDRKAMIWGRLCFCRSPCVSYLHCPTYIHQFWKVSPLWCHKGYHYHYHYWYSCLVGNDHQHPGSGCSLVPTCFPPSANVQGPIKHQFKQEAKS